MDLSQIEHKDNAYIPNKQTIKAKKDDLHVFLISFLKGLFLIHGHEQQFQCIYCSFIAILSTSLVARL